MKRSLAGTAVAIVLLCGLGATAGEPATGPLTYTPPTLPDSPSAGPLLLRLVLATGSVLAIGGLAALAVRRLAPRPPAGKSDPRLRLVETLSLGTGSTIYLLECCGRRFVAGVSPSGLRSLAPLPDAFENDLDALTAVR